MLPHRSIQESGVHHINGAPATCGEVGDRMMTFFTPYAPWDSEGQQVFSPQRTTSMSEEW